MVAIDTPRGQRTYVRRKTYLYHFVQIISTFREK